MDILAPFLVLNQSYSKIIYSVILYCLYCAFTKYNIINIIISYIIPYKFSYTVISSQSNDGYAQISKFLLLFYKEQFTDTVCLRSYNWPYKELIAILNTVPLIIKYKSTNILFTNTVEYIKTEKSDAYVSIIKLYFKSSDDMNIFIGEAEKIYKKEIDKNKIYNIETSGDEKTEGRWVGIENLINKNFTNSFINKNLLDKIKTNINNFLKRQKNPKFDAIPNKIGFVFYGLPGVGKTTLGIALANEYKRKIYQLDKNVINENFIKKYIRQIKPGNIVLINDADYIFNFPNADKKEYSEDEKKQNNIKTILYEIFDGYNYLEDTIIILTTNNLSKIDSTLIRPGRIDFKYEIGYPDKETLKEMYEFYTDNKIDIKQINDELCTLSTSTIINNIFSQDVDFINKNFIKI